MRSPFHKGPGPRIRALTGAPSRATAGGPAPSRAKAASPARAPAAPSVTAPQAVFREFVATLERLEKSRRRRKTPAAPSREG
ncbi:hypothetical protein V5F49_20725 [Xanthobacter sp. V3C-3]|uniref:hypothetical protein n=1 Tax=Xanthobacter lutulentifluminis TaxID=3119935 RepID=UPI00372B2D61